LRAGQRGRVVVQQRGAVAAAQHVRRGLPDDRVGVPARVLQRLARRHHEAQPVVDDQDAGVGQRRDEVAVALLGAAQAAAVLAAAQRVADGAGQHRPVDLVLDQEVGDPDALGLLVQRRVAHPGQQDDRRVGVVGQQLARGLQALAVGQVVVEQDDVGPLRAPGGAHLGQRRRLDDADAVAQAVRQPDRGQPAGRRQVVDHQHGHRIRGAHHTSTDRHPDADLSDRGRRSDGVRARARRRLRKAADPDAPA
jgi:hypothetical protein